jgi:hypothetical protein
MEQGLSPTAALRTIRIIWAALLIAVVSYLVVVYFIGPNRRPLDATMLELLLYMAIGMLVILVSIGFIFRAVTYRNQRDENGAVSPGAYVSGNIIFFACCEGPAFGAVTFWLLSATRGPHVMVALVAIAILLVSFPTGRAMRGDEGIQQIHKR